MKNLVLLLGLLFVCSCSTYSETVTIDGQKAIFLKKSSNAKEGILHIEKPDGSFLAFKINVPAGAGWDSTNCNSCLGLCVVKDPGLGSEYEACSSACNDSDCEGNLPNWARGGVVVNTVSASNLKMFKSQ